MSTTAVSIPPATDTFTVSMPFIRNTQTIEAGAEVILKWKPTNKRKTCAGDSNAFDQLLQQEKKRSEG